MKRHAIFILLTAFLAACGVRADEITGLNLRTSSGSQAQTPTATASTFLTLGADKKPVFLNAANSRTLLGLATSDSPTLAGLTLTAAPAPASASQPLLIQCQYFGNNVAYKFGGLGLLLGGYQGSDPETNCAAIWNPTSNGIVLSNNIYSGAITWSAADGTGTPTQLTNVLDLKISRDAAATLQLGQDHATTPTAQTIKAHDVTTGTGASLTIAGGKGSVAGGAVILATSATTGAPATVVTIKASGVVNIANLPTSASGLATGDLWNDSGTLKVAP